MACITANIPTDQDSDVWGRTVASPRSPDTLVEQGEGSGPLTAVLSPMERMTTRPVNPSAAEPLVERQFLEPEPSQQQDGEHGVQHVQESYVDTRQWFGMKTIQHSNTLSTLVSQQSDASSIYQPPAQAQEAMYHQAAQVELPLDFQAGGIVQVAQAQQQPETPEQPKLGVRYSGRCVKFEGTYGFLGTEQFTVEFFCHKDDLHCPKDAWKSLKVHEDVEFELTWDRTKNNYKAVKVTGPNGAYVVGTPKPPMRQRPDRPGRSKKNRNANASNNPWCHQQVPMQGQNTNVVCQGWMHGNCPLGKNCGFYHPQDQYNVARRGSLGRQGAALSNNVYQQ